MRTTDIIGRKPELETLKYLYDSQKSEFLAIYGRRRLFHLQEDTACAFS